MSITKQYPVLVVWIGTHLSNENRRKINIRRNFRKDWHFGHQTTKKSFIIESTLKTRAPMKLLVVLILTYLSMTQCARTPMLGVYVGNPNGNDANANKAMLQALRGHNAAMGVNVTCMNAFTDFSVPWSGGSNNMISNAGWSAWSWSLNEETKHLIPIVGIPMASTQDWSSQPAIDTFNAIANGTHDDTFLGIANAWKSNGFPLIYVRLGYEMNANFMPWSMGQTASSVNSWKAAFRRIAQVMKSVPDMTVKTVWNPAAANWWSVSIDSAYPGDDVVDVIGLDLYSIPWPGQLYNWARNDGTIDPNLATWQSNATNRIHFWDYPGANQWNVNANNGWGLALHIQFTIQHNKSIAIPESGVGVSPSYPNQGIADDGEFPLYLAQRLFADDAPPVEFVNVWDTNVGDGSWQFYDDASNKPNARRSWASFATNFASASAETPMDQFSTPLSSDTPAAHSPVMTTPSASIVNSSQTRISVSVVMMIFATVFLL